MNTINTNIPNYPKGSQDNYSGKPEKVTPVIFEGHEYTPTELQQMREALQENVTVTNPINYANASDIDVIKAVNDAGFLNCTLTTKPE